MINLPPFGEAKFDNMDIDKYLPEELRGDFEKFKEAKKNGNLESFSKGLKEKYDNMDNESQERYLKAADSSLVSVTEACDDFIDRAEEFILRQRLGELPEVISFSYIARRFFGKSRQWLYQRVNGSIVNGKQARFTKEEYEKFISALDEISMMITNTSASLKLN